MATRADAHSPRSGSVPVDVADTEIQPQTSQTLQPLITTSDFADSTSHVTSHSPAPTRPTTRPPQHLQSGNCEGRAPSHSAINDEAGREIETVPSVGKSGKISPRNSSDAKSHAPCHGEPPRDIPSINQVFRMSEDISQINYGMLYRVDGVPHLAPYFTG